MNTLIAKRPHTQTTDLKCAWIQKARLASHRVPPLWSLKNFVAVNPFVGLVGRPFAEVCELIRRVTHDSMLMDQAWFKVAFESGRITERDLREALEATPKAESTNQPSEIDNVTVDELMRYLDDSSQGHSSELNQQSILTVCDVVDQQLCTSWSSVVNEEIAKWCAAFFDDGQAAWRMPWHAGSLFSAWGEAAVMDLSMEIQGLGEFREMVESLPAEAPDAIACILNELNLAQEGAEDYLHRLFMSLPGWSAFVQWRVREKAMHGTHDEMMLDLLAIRLTYELALFRKYAPGIRGLSTGFSISQPSAVTRSTFLHTLWHSALERSFQRELLGKLIDHQSDRKPNEREVPEVQAVFCIDVRSEVIRRSLETVSPSIKTLGFAGFFGMAIEYIPFGKRHGTSQCPVLLSPQFRVREGIPNAEPDTQQRTLRKQQLGRRVAHSWTSFRNSAVSCFSFVESAGIASGWKLLNDTFQITSSKTKPQVFAPDLNPREHPCSGHERNGSEIGITEDDQVKLAFGALKNMGLVSHFARLVLFCGHGSNTKNNPYGSGLDCGACGGHSGDSNARVGAAILNRKAVRAALKEKHGICIPEDTIFLSGLHDTTTDQITLFDTESFPSSHLKDLVNLKESLKKASNLTRRQRSPMLGIHSTPSRRLNGAFKFRSNDWSQVRPEWGLAGNAAFIAAPRERTKSINLKGRVFLHNYHSEADSDFSTLELIMTAPMIVASWINMQYFASTVNNAQWGSGNKVTHNVVGTHGVCQGNEGDLKVGLPMQSLHDGKKWVHEPLRLTVILEAPPEAISSVISRNETVRQLVDNGWLHLFALEDGGRKARRYLPGNNWE
jgi:uncharacterized protein